MHLKVKIARTTKICGVVSSTNVPDKLIKTDTFTLMKGKARNV